jgi:hypothetical protein
MQLMYTDSCATINDAYLDVDREVRLNLSVDAVGSTCFEIDASNFILDCQGYSITDDIEPAFGIGIISNVSIKNCTFYSSGRLVVGISSRGWFNSTFSNLSFISSSVLYLENQGLFPNNNFFENIFFEETTYLMIEDGFQNTFQNIIFNTTLILMQSNSVNNTFRNNSFSTQIDFSNGANSNIFYNNFFENSSLFTSDNWSLSQNYFNFSGQGNSYGDVNTSIIICFDDPLNLTCDYFATPLILSSVSSSNSLFPVQGVFSLLIMLLGVVWFLN